MWGSLTPQHSSTMVSLLSSTSPNLTLVATCGKQVVVHPLLLALHSSTLATLLQEEEGSTAISLPLPLTTLQALVSYMYNQGKVVGDLGEATNLLGLTGVEEMVVKEQLKEELVWEQVEEEGGEQVVEYKVRGEEEEYSSYHEEMTLEFPFDSNSTNTSATAVFVAEEDIADLTLCFAFRVDALKNVIRDEIQLIRLEDSYGETQDEILLTIHKSSTFWSGTKGGESFILGGPRMALMTWMRTCISDTVSDRIRLFMDLFL